MQELFINIIVIGLLALTVVNYRNKLNKGVDIEASKVNIHEDMKVGKLVIDYESQEYLLFHGEIGLFLYNIDKKILENSLNLHNINCHEMEDGRKSHMIFKEDQKKIYIFREDDDKFMLEYNLPDNSLKKIDRLNIKNDYDEEKYKGKLLGDTSKELIYIRDDEEYRIFDLS